MKKLLIIFLLISQYAISQGISTPSTTVNSGTVNVTNNTYMVLDTNFVNIDSIYAGNNGGKVLLNADGIFLRDSATQWIDLVINASLINPTGSPSPPTIDNTDGTYLFVNGQVNTATFIFQLPHGWKEGSNISFHIHGCKISTGSGTPLFRSKYRWNNIGDTATSYTNLDTLTLASGLTDNNRNGQHLIYENPDYNGTGKGLSSILIVYLERTATATGDNYEADWKLYSVDLHIQIESFGSRREYQK